MSVVINRAARGGVKPPQPPLRADGTRYPLALCYSAGTRIAYADTASDLLALLIPGYKDLDDQARLVARIRLAYRAAVAGQAQALINADPQDVQALSDREYAALVRPQYEPVRLEWWTSPVVLLLVSTAYAPYGHTDRPLSALADVLNPPNIIWLRPEQETTLLESLVRSGYIQGMYAPE